MENELATENMENMENKLATVSLSLHYMRL